MKRFYFFCLLLLFTSCQDDLMIDPVPNMIAKSADFIDVKLKVQPFSKDSIMVETKLTNNSDSNFWFYKPFLPESPIEDVFAILENRTYEDLDFQNRSKEKHIVRGGQEAKDYSPDNFYIFKPHESLTLSCNIAKAYSFRKSFKKGINNFSVVYYAICPYVIDGKQVFQYDSLQKKKLPCYYYINGLKPNEDVDSVRVPFTVDISH